MEPSNPIGVFDSGVGGLTVVSALKAVLPDEQILYFGDTARCPYGDKSPEDVRRYSVEICDFLVDKGVKLLVVACNTATAVALSTLVARYSVPVVGVVRPGARAAVRGTNGKIGVIGTSVTVASGVYPDAVHDLNPELSVESLACPEFVPLVEQGLVMGGDTQHIVTNRLRPMRDRGIDTLILGCTHYPLLEAVIQTAMGPTVRLISSAKETALEVRSILERENGAQVSGVAADDVYYTSGDGARMMTALRDWLRLGAEDVIVEHVASDFTIPIL